MTKLQITKFLINVSKGRIQTDRSDLATWMRFQEQAKLLLGPLDPINKPRVDWYGYQEPDVVTDNVYNREWVSRTPFQYYLHNDEDGWCVIDRSTDLPVGKTYKTKRAAINQFLKKNATTLE